ncbi:hypothetical protein MIND_01377400 [Mycena indigotica]|uniref:F-box domain-containing protein n=1 Tax=Mycena indigotica TaxID=2126181 RepID=A0A8H6RYS6_9AGAR|nr:uncharacterized protein MIND_01377400 [Mycena indigotica]KAF7289163.1 hypothetical protein MIND_01377400 [Mycena indigotica]
MLIQRDYLTAVPSEIWLNCWSLCTTPELMRLCLTCRAFAVICQPLRFRRMHRHPPTDEALRNNGSSLEKLAEDVERRLSLFEGFVASPYVSAVRSWHFSRVRIAKSEDLLDSVKLTFAWLNFLDVFLGSLGAFSRTTKLTLLAFDFDEIVWDALQALASLEDLTFSSSHVEENPGPPLKLKHLRVVLVWPRNGGETCEADQLRIAAPETLVELETPYSHHVYPLLLAFVVDSTPLLQLTRLQLDLIYNILPILSSFLALCPNLASLELVFTGEAPQIIHYPDTFPKSTIPSLRSLIAPLPLVNAIVPDRPIRDLVVDPYPGIEGWDEVRQVLDNIKSGSIENLTLHHHIPPQETENVLTEIGQRFPGLQSLSIHIEEPESYMLVVDLTEDEDEDCVSAEKQKQVTTRAEAKLPATELPGHRYDSRGLEQPPPTLTSALLDLPLPSAQTELALRHLLSPRLELPVGLKTFKVSFGHEIALSESVQHLVLLRLERALPTLQTLTLCRQSWVRDHHLWTTRPGMKRVKIVSRAWQEDGTRLDGDI